MSVVKTIFQEQGYLWERGASVGVDLLTYFFFNQCFISNYLSAYLFVFAVF